ncbi:MAG: C25 family cysteine peptidase [Pirellulales bacterium]
MGLHRKFVLMAAAACSIAAITPIYGQSVPSQPPAVGDSTPSATPGKVQITIRQNRSGSAVIAVRPRSWAQAIEKWKQFRSAQGHEIVELDSSLSRDELQQSIRRIAAERSRGTAEKRIGYVILMGDAPQGERPIAHVQPKPPKRGAGPLDPAVVIPTFYRESTALVKYGGDKELATDVPYADLDGDEIPELAIGRIPADTSAELKECLSRTMAYEQLNDFGPWRRELRVVAGVGGFGALADGVIEMTTRRFLTDRVPSWADVCT